MRLSTYLKLMLPTTLRDRALVRVGGDEARAFLQGLLTQDVPGLTPGTPRYGALLSPQGKALFDMLLWADPAGSPDVLLDCEAARAEALMKRLTIYRLRRPITIARDESLAVHWSAEPQTGSTADPRLAELGYRWLASASDGDAADAFRTHRLRHGVPEGAAELGEDKTLWLECNGEDLHGVDYKKGCYIGQENTARMHYRQKVNRRLMVLPLDQSDPARQRIAYPALDLAIDHRPVESVNGLTIAPWLAAAIAQAND